MPATDKLSLPVRRSVYRITQANPRMKMREDPQVVKQCTQCTEKHNGGEDAKREILKVGADLAIGKPAQQESLCPFQVYPMTVTKVSATHRKAAWMKGTFNTKKAMTNCRPRAPKMVRQATDFRAEENSHMQRREDEDSQNGPHYLLFRRSISSRSMPARS